MNESIDNAAPRGIKGKVSFVREISPKELLDMADPGIRGFISNKLFTPGGGVMVFEVMALDSSQAGHRTFLSYGPGRTHTKEEAAAGNLGDVPSRHAYPIAYADTPEGGL